MNIQGPQAPDESDRVNWLRSLNGDPQGFARIYDRYADQLYGYALRRTSSSSIAEDIVSITFLEAWRKRDAVHFDESAMVVGWLFGIARNVVRNHKRSEHRYETAILRLRAAASAPDPAEAIVEQLAAEDRVREFRELFTLLSRRDQDLLALVWSGLDQRALAVALGLSNVATRSRLSRARGRLRKLSAEHGVSIEMLTTNPRRGSLPEVL